MTHYSSFQPTVPRQEVHTAEAEEVPDEETREERTVEPFVMIDDEGLINDSEEEALKQLTYLIFPVFTQSFLE